MTQPKMPEVGPIGRNLIANVDRLRSERGLSWRRLSAELDRAGRPIFPLGLRRMAKAERRVDVDELVALAQVLGVTPAALLAPPDAGDTTDSDHPAMAVAANLTARIKQLLSDPEDRDVLDGYLDRALRRLQIEVEELIAESSRTRDPGHRHA